jgi:hypothetical protein
MPMDLWNVVLGSFVGWSPSPPKRSALRHTEDLINITFRPMELYAVTALCYLNMRPGEADEHRALGPTPVHP